MTTTATTDARAVRLAPPLDLLLGASLFLDFDGTLVELAERPDAIVVGERLPAVLARLHERLDGRLAIVSGRSAAQVRDFLGASGMTVVGSHGLEFLFADGRAATDGAPAALPQVRAEMVRLAAQWEHVLVEDKPLGAVLHYRLCPEAEDSCVALARDLAERHGLHLQTGKMMIEVRAAGGDKGTAIRRLMDEPDMRGTRPVFIGDDDTDEPALVVAEALGGAGVLVGPDRATAARYRLPSASAVVDWLEEAAKQ
jgi:trehalose 6-phosphate phosphatase